MTKGILTSIPKTPVVRLSTATFFRHHPNSNSTSSNPPLFPNTNLDIFPSESNAGYWAVVGPAGSGKTTFLECLQGQHICEPSQARSYPYLPRIGATKPKDARFLRNREVSKAVRYAGFGGKGAKLAGVETRGSYMAARYESRHEAEDFSLKDYLLGNTDPNPAEFKKGILEKRNDEARLERVAKALQLEELLEQPALVLSNGQTRRARIAAAFMEFPLLLLLDEPFLGIDPIHHRILQPALWSLSRRSGPNLVLALGNDEVPPRWVTHLICLDNCQVAFSGPKDEVYEKALAQGYPLATTRIKRSLWRGAEALEKDDTGMVDENEDIPDEFLNEDENASLEESAMDSEFDSTRTNSPRWNDRWDNQLDVIDCLHPDEPVIEMKGVQVDYGKLIALGNWQQPNHDTPGLHWTIRRGERWGIFGPNGSGKTTILSLVNSDHPKSYSQSVSYFGRSRLPESGQLGITIFDLQSRIMQASPEVHAFFPKKLSIRETLENAWADTFLSKPTLTRQIDETVDAALRWFEKELNPGFAGPDPLMSLSAKHTSPPRKPEERVASYTKRSIDWADNVRLSETSFAVQRLALFLRAVIKKPDLVVLDEAFSGMDKATRIKCMMFLAYGETKWLTSRISQKRKKEDHEYDELAKSDTPLEELGACHIGPFEARQALVVVAHEQDEVPPLVDQYLFLEEPGTKKPPRFGTIERSGTRPPERANWWDKLWNEVAAGTNKDSYNKAYDPGKYARQRRSYRLTKDSVEVED